MSRVHVVGSINQDLLVSTEVYPKLGETVHGIGAESVPGGKGANQAVAAAHLGAATHFVGLVGDDRFGEAMRANLEQAGVDVRHVGVVSGTETGLAIVTRTTDGRNAIVVIGGTNALVDADQVRAGLADLGPGDVVVCQLEVPVEAVAAALRQARQAGATAILNAAPAAAVAELLGDVDVLVVNEFEAQIVAGEPEPANDYEVLAKLLAERHDLAAVVTLGSDGAWLASSGQTTRIAAHPIEAVDSTGAGDTFVGALAAFLAQGHPIELAAQWASAAGAHACLRVGAQAGAPTLAELAERFGVGPGTQV